MRGLTVSPGTSLSSIFTRKTGAETSLYSLSAPLNAWLMSTLSRSVSVASVSSGKNRVSGCGLLQLSRVNISVAVSTAASVGGAKDASAVSPLVAVRTTVPVGSEASEAR